MDAIADVAGGRLVQTACPALRPGGQIAAIATPELDLDQLLDANITFHGMLVQDDGDRTRAGAALPDRRVLRPSLARCSRSRLRHTGYWKAGTPAARSCSTSRAASVLS